MALGKAYTKPVVFISGSPLSDPEAEPSLRGTGFLVGFRSEVNPGQGQVYIVTAAHVVRPLTAALVRLNKPDGSIADHVIDEWIFHPTEDIGIARLPPPYSDYEFLAVEAKDFVGAEELEYSPQPGADVFVAGLLGLVPSMGERNIPMVRTGSIGAMYQDAIPMRSRDNTRINVRGHLIDCQSFGGFSGSPCFVRFISGSETTENLGLRIPKEPTLLLGMVGGHFDLQASVSLPDQEGKLSVPVAAGVAVVYPAEAIRETLDTDELVAERAELEARLEAEKTDEAKT
jgi:hypothetical protein